MLCLGVVLATTFMPIAILKGMVNAAKISSSAMGKIANRQSLAILDRGLKSQPFSQFCCIRMLKKNRQSRVSNRNVKSQRRHRFESHVFKSLAILDLDRAISPF